MTANKQWTMNCILAGVEVSRLLGKGEHKKAKEYLRGLTSELLPEDIEYLFTRCYAIATKSS